MNIFNFERHHINEAATLALTNYYDERRFVQDLPQECDIPDLNSYAENGLGVAVFEGGKMIGFLCCCEPFDNVFRATDVRGIFSPMGANAAVSENRSNIYAAMYQTAGAKWVQSGAVSHAVCLYAHDEALQQQFYRYGFGLRCLDSIRPTEWVDCKPCADYEFTELPKTECHSIYPLYLALNGHYCESPFFMNRKPETQEEFMISSMPEEVQYFVAKQDGRICAFLRISASGETFVATGNHYRHITGAYCLPEHRGKDVYQNLLNFESFNPTGRGFWLKYFTTYTNSVVRRIDERITQRTL